MIKSYFYFTILEILNFNQINYQYHKQSCVYQCKVSVCCRPKIWRMFWELYIPLHSSPPCTRFEGRWVEAPPSNLVLVPGLWKENSMGQQKLETQQIFIQKRESTRNYTVSFHWNETISCIERQQHNEFTNVHHLGDFMKTNFGGNYHRNVDALSAFKYIFMAWHGIVTWALINTH